MDERKLKRLVITVLIAIVIIILAKFMLTRTYADLNKAAAARKPAALLPAASVVPVVEPAIEAPASAPVSAVEDGASVISVQNGSGVQAQ